MSAYQRHIRKKEPVDELCVMAAREYRNSKRRGMIPISEPDDPDGPKWRCPVCTHREPVEYPGDAVALRMAKVRHLGESHECDRAIRQSVGVPASV